MKQGPEEPWSFKGPRSLLDERVMPAVEEPVPRRAGGKLSRRRSLWELHQETLKEVEKLRAAPSHRLGGRREGRTSAAKFVVMNAPMLSTFLVGFIMGLKKD